MSRSKPANAKRQELRERGCLHPHPETVTHELFVRQEFFDPSDLVQVKYEMLRNVRAEGEAVQNAARAFGLSRPTFYQAQAAFDRSGLLGLLPAKKGPRRSHKLSEEVMNFVMEELTVDTSLQASELARRIHQRFDITVHPRSIRRAFARYKQKKPE
jgi:transposase